MIGISGSRGFVMQNLSCSENKRRCRRGVAQGDWGMTAAPFMEEALTDGVLKSNMRR
jgi:hypothetical protein